MLLLVSYILICQLLFEIVISAPKNEFQLINMEEEFSLSEDKWIKNMIVDMLSMERPSEKRNKVRQLPDIDHENQHFKSFLTYMEQVVTDKGNIFTIYDDKNREAAIALYNLLKSLNKDDRVKVEEWASKNINSGIYSYAKRLYYLFGEEYTTENNEEIPEFIRHPNHFVPSEVITKLLGVNFLRLLKKDFTDSAIGKLGNYVVIDSNYTNWDKENGHGNDVYYFTEDISLNAYYYGINLANPFWMSEEEIKKINPRNNEHLYFIHKQLLARFLLEVLSLKKCYTNEVTGSYNPNLVHDNLKDFPRREELDSSCTNDKLKIFKMDTFFLEYLNRGKALLANGTVANLTEDNHIDFIVNMLRANLDNVKIAYTIRTNFGLGKVPNDTTEVIPTVLHFPETMLRDPGTFYLFDILLAYFSVYSNNSLTPLDLKQFDSKEYKIINMTHSKLETYFEPFVFDISKALNENPVLVNKMPASIAVKQRRLNNKDFSFRLHVHSIVDKMVTVRYFIAPLCNKTACCVDYYQFFQLDQVQQRLVKGENLLVWYSADCVLCADDEYFNLNNSSPARNEYTMFKFPRRLLLPKGRPEGFNVTLFVIMTEDTPYDMPKNNYNRHFNLGQSSRPLGFPFQREVANCEHDANNFGFYNITIYE